MTNIFCAIVVITQELSDAIKYNTNYINRHVIQLFVSNSTKISFSDDQEPIPIYKWVSRYQSRLFYTLSKVFAALDR